MISDNIIELAHELYFIGYEKKCTFQRYWNKVWKEQKWRIQSTQSGGSKRTKIGTCGAYSFSSNPEIPTSEDVGVESLVHPQDTKVSKRKGKGK